MPEEPAAEATPAEVKPTEPKPVEPAAEAAPPSAEPVDTGYTPSGVPTFESVREKIETRYGTAIGATELDAESPEGRTIEEQYDARQRAAAERLAEIRKSIHQNRTTLTNPTRRPELRPGRRRGSSPQGSPIMIPRNQFRDRLLLLVHDRERRYAVGVEQTRTTEDAGPQPHSDPDGQPAGEVLAVDLDLGAAARADL